MADLSPMVVAEILKDVINAGASYLECKEIEQTKRERIAAELEAKLTLINKHYDLCEKELANHHELAMKAYEKAEKMLNNPKVMEDVNLLKAVLTFLGNAHADNVNSISRMFPSGLLR